MKWNMLALCLILTACGAGNVGPSGPQGATGAPGKSAYELWLDAGNTGTLQDFLDSLVGDNNSDNDDGEQGGDNNADNNQVEPMCYPKNTKEYMEYVISLNPNLYSNATEEIKTLGTSDVYKEYSWEVAPLSYSYESEQKTKLIYKEKELNLGNYGLLRMQYQYGFDDDYSLAYYTAYIHNREGVGENIYTPTIGTVFKGTTMAYLHKNQIGENEEPTFIYGTSRFTYDPSTPSIDLIFSGYHNLQFTKQATGGYNVKITGANSTGKPEYDLPTGEFTDKDIDIEMGYVSKGATQEAFGTYSEHFYDSDYGKTGTIETPFYITGAFGGTKQ